MIVISQKEVQIRAVGIKQASEDSSEPQAIDMSQPYVDVVDGVKKRRINDLETQAASFITGGANTSSSATSVFDQDVMRRHVMEDMEQQMKERMDAMMAQLEARMREWMEARIRECMEAMLAQMDAKIEARVQAHMMRLLEELRHQGVLPPPAQPPIETRPVDNVVDDDNVDLGVD